MKLSAKQLRNLINEAAEGTMRARDVDTGQKYNIAVSAFNDYGAVRINFGNSFSITLEHQDAQELADTISDVTADYIRNMEV